jgi:hypothetical protein
VQARSRSVAVEDVERELYDERVLVRMMGMRRTVFVLPAELAPVVQAACSDGVAASLKRRTRSS